MLHYSRLLVFTYRGIWRRLTRMLSGVQEACRHHVTSLGLHVCGKFKHSKRVCFKIVGLQAARLRAMRQRRAASGPRVRRITMMTIGLSSTWTPTRAAACGVLYRWRGKAAWAEAVQRCLGSGVLFPHIVVRSCASRCVQVVLGMLPQCSGCYCLLVPPGCFVPSSRPARLL